MLDMFDDCLWLSLGLFSDPENGGNMFLRIIG
jgi:hypothetical protein